MENSKLGKIFQKWESRSSHEYINAIYRPCWEIKYCPYGPLVEDFPLDRSPEYGCKIFGHICPVFKVAEPFTETTELRNITRHIPQTVKFAVNRRDNFICQECGQHVRDNDVNYDHIIPYSKGGSSEASNIRLLCSTCNKKRGNDFEDTHLIVRHGELYSDPLSLESEMIQDLLEICQLLLILEKQDLDEARKNLFSIIKTDDLETDIFVCSLVFKIKELLSDDEVFTVKKKLKVLKIRWGLIDGVVRSIQETCEKEHVAIEYYFKQEQLLMRQIGFVLPDNSVKSTQYINCKPDKIELEELVDDEFSENDRIQ